MTRYEVGPARGGQSLVDVLDRILEKGLVIAGDIRIDLADVELLTIRVRLLVCSIDKAQEIGLDWWRHDGFLTSGGSDRPRLAGIEEQMAALGERLRAVERGLRADPDQESDAVEVEE